MVFFSLKFLKFIVEEWWQLISCREFFVDIFLFNVMKYQISDVFGIFFGGDFFELDFVIVFLCMRVYINSLCFC